MPVSLRVLLLILAVAPLVRADWIQLTDGTTIVGHVLSVGTEVVRIEHPELGTLELPRAGLDRLVMGDDPERRPPVGTVHRSLDEVCLLDRTRLLGELLEDRAGGVLIHTAHGEHRIPEGAIALVIVRRDRWGPRSIPAGELAQLLEELRARERSARRRAINRILMSEDPAARDEAEELLLTAPGAVQLRCNDLPILVGSGQELEGELQLLNVDDHPFWVSEGGARLDRRGIDATPLARNDLRYEVRVGWLPSLGLGGGGGRTFGGTFGPARGSRLRREPGDIPSDLDRRRWLRPGELLPAGRVNWGPGLDQARFSPPALCRLPCRLLQQGEEEAEVRFRWRYQELPPLRQRVWRGEVECLASVALLTSLDRRLTAFVDAVRVETQPGGSLALTLTSTLAPLGQAELEALDPDPPGSCWCCPHPVAPGESSRSQHRCNEGFLLSERFLGEWRELDGTFRWWFLIRETDGPLRQWGELTWQTMQCPGDPAPGVPRRWRAESPGEGAVLQGELEDLQLPPGDHQLMVGVTYGSSRARIFTERSTPWASFTVP